MAHYVATHSDVWHETIYSLAFVVVLFEHSRRPLVHVFLNKTHAPRYSDVVFLSLIRNIDLSVEGTHVRISSNKFDTTVEFAPVRHKK